MTLYNIVCVYRFWSTLLTDALQLFEREEVRPYLHSFESWRSESVIASRFLHVKKCWGRD